MTETRSSAPPLDRRSLSSALGLILVGGPLVVIDLTVSQMGGLDLLNDTVGYALLLWAAALLARLPGPPLFASRIRVVGAITAITLPWSVLVQADPFLRVSAIGILTSALAVVATILFCAAMRDLSGFHGFPASRRAWSQATKIAAVFLGGMWLIATVAALLGSLQGGSFTPAVSPGPGGAVGLILVALAVMLVPLISILVAIGTLRRELRVGTEVQPELP